MVAQGTIRRGSRCSTSKAFIRPIRLRTNLHIALNTQVARERNRNFISIVFFLFKNIMLNKNQMAIDYRTIIIN